MNRFKIAIVYLLSFTSSAILAQIPKLISYQGALSDSTGAAIADGEYTIHFRIYDDSTNGILLWKERANMHLIRGVVIHSLGSVEPLTLAFTKPYWLGMAIDGEPELRPRLQFTAAAYSLASAASESVSGETNSFPSQVFVGIGLENAAEKALDVNGTIRSRSGGFQFPDGSIQTTAAGSAATAGRNSLDASDGDPAQALFLNHKGDVGIGTTQPLAGLHVQKNEIIMNGHTQISDLEIASPKSFIRWHLRTGDDITGLAPHQLHFQYDVFGNYRSNFSLLSNGTTVFHHNVGIGTAIPREKLSVNGTIRAKEIIVTQKNWPDFVFQPAYQLMSLEALEQFIAENGHLPDIPSAGKIAKEDLRLGEMQAKLLQKIEELTLHLIEMQKEKNPDSLRAALVGFYFY